MSVAQKSPCEPAQRKSSIETEPRTLHEDQISEAQDAAINVIQTKGSVEAMEIFTTPTGEVQSLIIKENEDGVEDMKGLLDNMSEQPAPPYKIPSAPF
ncbi:hypothetical protein KP509_02G100700 [Ceratopteris richardii]|uniref:Uncharacterized protein n=1 Tax=Ceratopteris richardii TaxID=49495 RepID=A0A8T2VH48_CERRI|nr:hypothetical protein KP509_02G100700 [Ceratopteris richardii]KAH7444983.1 hypothetical protein KP509_02G100700 [Ceratopteris richardii]